MTMALRVAQDRTPLEREEDLRSQVAICEPDLRQRARTLTGSAADAADLVQDTIERALRSLGRFRPGTNMRLWLLTIMKNLFFDQCRYSNVRRRLTHAASGLTEVPASPSAEDPEPVPMWAQVSAEQFHAAINRLDPVSREVFRLRTTERLSYGEIAVRLSICPSTVGTRLYRSRTKLRHLLMEGLQMDGEVGTRSLVEFERDDQERDEA